MKFDYIIGNPPYQDEAVGDQKTFTAPIYHKFLDGAFQVADTVELIHPARFLFDAGSTPKKWNRKMLKDPHFKIISYEQDSKNIFPNTDVKGGIAISYHDVNQDFGGIEVFTPYQELTSILKKVRDNNDFVGLETIAVSRTSYKLSKKLHDENPDAINSLSRGHAYDVSSNIFRLLPELFLSEVPDDGYEYVKVLGRLRNERIHKYVKRDYLTCPDNFDKFRIFIPKASGSGEFGETITKPLIVEPDVASTETFLSIGFFDNYSEAENALSYIKTKFCRALLGILKTTQDITPGKFKYVPLQDFTVDSDIDWDKPVNEIDKQLYKKYNLSDEEIEFIETHVKEM